MRILCIEDQPGAGTNDVQALGAAGHQVVHCHDDGAPVFPCAALVDMCPLDQPNGIDLVVDSRTSSSDQPVAAEAGATCALRNGIPVLVSGDATSPLTGWAADRRASEPLVDACERAVDEAFARRSAPLRAEVERILAGESRPGGSEVQITRCGGATRIAVRVPGPVPSRLAGTITTRVHAVDRQRPSAGSTLDVGISSTPPE